MTLGQVVTLPSGQVVGPNTPGEQIVRNLGVNRANYDTSTKVGMRHFYRGLVVKSIPSDWLIENPRWPPFSKMVTNK